MGSFWFILTCYPRRLVLANQDEGITQPTDQTPSHAFLNPPWPSLGPSHSFFHSKSGLQKMTSTLLAEGSDVGAAKEPFPRRVSHMTWMSNPQFRGSWKTSMAWNLTLERSSRVRYFCGCLVKHTSRGDPSCTHMCKLFLFGEFVERIDSRQPSARPRG